MILIALLMAFMLLAQFQHYFQWIFVNSLAAPLWSLVLVDLVIDIIDVVILIDLNVG